ncbi:MAG: carbon storage regulator CsrA [Acidimicrobiales bacterium]
MLVLSRRANQAIVIGPDIVIRVLDIRGDQVRIGVDAPRSVAVHREEVAADIRQSNEEAARLGAVAALDLPKPGRDSAAHRRPRTGRRDDRPGPVHGRSAP